MSCFRTRALLALAWAIFTATSAVAAPMFMRDVRCGDTLLGRMEIDTYAVGERGTGTAKDPFQGFVTIDGQFDRAPGARKEYHNIQAVIRDDRPPNFHDGTAITTTYIDPPPGGYEDDPFDLEPYYDGGPFPRFFDEPTINLAFTKNQADLQRELEFETWLVCVISETLGADPTKASDDTYKVAPLLGWKWGFEQTYMDRTPMGDGLEDIDQTIIPFAFLAAPSAAWTASLGRVYGMGVNQDRFNVLIGDCTDCVVPEPSSAVLLGVGFLGLLGYGRRRRSRGAWTLSRRARNGGELGCEAHC